TAAGSKKPRPNRRLRATTVSSSCPKRRKTAYGAAPHPSTPHSGGGGSNNNNKCRKEDYDRGTCTCQSEQCDPCKRTCFYAYHRGARAGQACMRIFPTERLADLDRHKASHAAMEWFWCEVLDVLTIDEVPWYRAHPDATGYFCPNGASLDLVPDE